MNDGARNALDAYLDGIVAEARADERRKAFADAYAACERQTVLASMVAGRPTDFEKGVMSCMAAVHALAGDHEIRRRDA